MHISALKIQKLRGPGSRPQITGFARPTPLRCGIAQNFYILFIQHTVNLWTRSCFQWFRIYHGQPTSYYRPTCSGIVAANLKRLFSSWTAASFSTIFSSVCLNLLHEMMSESTGSSSILLFTRTIAAMLWCEECPFANRSKEIPKLCCKNKYSLYDINVLFLHNHKWIAYVCNGTEKYLALFPRCKSMNS